MSTVNIVMATYNGEKYLKQQIESILGASYTDWSLFIFDDGSTDNTLEIAQDFEKRYPERIQVYQNERNLGVTLNFLTGLKKVYQLTNLEETPNVRAKMHPYSSNHAKYYMLCDQDDVWHRDKITVTLERMKFLEKKYGKEKAQLVFTDAKVVDENLNKIYQSFFSSQRLCPYNTDLAHMLMENKCIGCTVMMNRSVVRLLKKLPKNPRYHDWWLGLIVSSFGHIDYLDTQTLNYRQHGNNVVGSKSFLDYVKLRIKSLQQQKKSLLGCINQGSEFLEIYQDALSEKERKLLTVFASISKVNWFKKRYLLLRYGFLKSGFVRNIGLLIII